MSPKHLAASSASAFPPMLTHAATEEMLGRSGLSWTALRHGFYAGSGLMLMGDFLKMGVVEALADGKVSWTAHADLAQAAAIILADDGPPPLTGSQALDRGDLADVASDLLGRPSNRQVITDEAPRAKMAARGLPPLVAEVTLGLHRASRADERVPGGRIMTWKGNQCPTAFSAGRLPESCPPDPGSFVGQFDPERGEAIPQRDHRNNHESSAGPGLPLRAR